MPDKECPPCSTHSKMETFEAQGMVITGAKALYDADADMVQAVYDQLGQFEGHIAISMYAMMIGNVADIMGVSPIEILDRQREQINAAIAATG